MSSTKITRGRLIIRHDSSQGACSIRPAAEKPFLGRILVIEDNSDCREMLRLLLRHDRYGVETAEDGLKGLEVLRRGKLDVVLIDIGWSGLDGYDLARQIRHTPDGKHMGLIALTGYGH